MIDVERIGDLDVLGTLLEDTIELELESIVFLVMMEDHFVGL